VSRLPGGSSYGRALILAVLIMVIIMVPAVRTLVMTIWEGLK
jgi:hypothetical protein